VPDETHGVLPESRGSTTEDPGAFIGDVSVDEEINALNMGRPHLVLLGAGASKAALPSGDRNGRVRRSTANEQRFAVGYAVIRIDWRRS